MVKMFARNTTTPAVSCQVTCDSAVLYNHAILFHLAKIRQMMHNSRMPRICALITTCGHTKTELQRCIELLNKQSLKPTDIIIAGNITLAEQVSSALPMHPIQAENGSAECRAKGMQTAFEVLNGDYVWDLEADAQPAENCLRKLVDAQSNAAGIYLPCNLTAEGKTAFPPCVLYNGQRKLIQYRDDIPQTAAMELCNALPGGLYPRAVWQACGLPTAQLIMQGESEEYAARLRANGLNYHLVPEAELLYTTTPNYLCYKTGGDIFIYRIGKTLEEHYYLMRNRAWTERVVRRKQYLRRLISCGFYMLNTLRAMLQSGEFSIKRAYLVFRGQHNGFYGKLRPY